MVERKSIVVAVGRRDDGADRRLAASQVWCGNAILKVDVVCDLCGSSCTACADHARGHADFAVAEDVGGDDVEDAHDEGNDAAGFDHLEEAVA